MKRKTIRKHLDFYRPHDCLTVRAVPCIIKAKPAKLLDDARYGIVVSKRGYFLSTKRNRAKRLLRDWIGFNEKLMEPELDYVFFANDNLDMFSRETGRQEIATALKKISKLYGKK